MRNKKKKSLLRGKVVNIQKGDLKGGGLRKIVSLGTFTEMRKILNKK